MFEEIQKSALTVVSELVESANLKAGDLLVIGCSSSEIVGGKIGKNSSPQAAEAVFEAVYPLLKEKGIYLAAQCCEHLNRAVILEEKCAKARGYEIVSVIPQPKAGGSFATAAYKSFTSPVAVEEIRADAGIDIGGTLIGMHLKRVAVPVRLSMKKIGEADVICARTRPKFIGGCRAVYPENV